MSATVAPSAGEGGWSIGVIEGLHLSGVDPGKHDLIRLPPKVEGGDGAPARPILRSTDGG